MTLANRIVFVGNLAFFAFAVWLVATHGAAAIKPGAWEYKDLIAVLLSVVSIIVTCIGIVVAVAAIWGYQSLRNVAEQKAEETSRTGVDLYLQSDDFKLRVEATLQLRLEAEAKEAVQNALCPAVLGADDAPEFRQDDREWQD